MCYEILQNSATLHALYTRKILPTSLAGLQPCFPNGFINLPLKKSTLCTDVLDINQDTVEDSLCCCHKYLFTC